MRSESSRLCRPARAVRAFGRRAPWALLALGLLLTSDSARAGTLRVDADALPCANRPEIVAEIEKRTANLMLAQPDLTLTIRVSAAQRLELILSGASGSAQREVEFVRGDCPAFAQIVSWIVQGWIGRRWRLPGAPIDSAGSPPPAPPLRTPVVADSPAVSEPEPEARTLRAVLLGGGFATRTAAESGLTARAAADWDLLPAAGASALVGADGRVALACGPGRIAVSLWSVALAGRWILQASSGSRLDLLVAPGLDFLTARAEGFPVVSTRNVAVPTLTLGTRWRQRLGGDLAAVAGLELTARARRQAFYVRDIGQEFALSTARLRLLAGVAWEFD